MRNLLTLVLPVLLLGARPAAAQDGALIELKMDAELELGDFLQQVSQTTGKPILFDPNSQRIRGQKIGVGLAMSVEKARAFDLFQAILAFYEIRLVAVGPKGHEVYQAIDSRSTNNYVKQRAVVVEVEDLEKWADKDGAFIQCVVPVRHIRNLTTLRTALSTLVTPAGIGRVHEVPDGGHILLVDFAPNVCGMVELIRRMDVETRKVGLMELQHADAEEVVSSITALFSRDDAPVAARRGVVPAGHADLPRVSAYKRRNAIVYLAQGADVDLIRTLVTQLDVPGERRKAATIRAGTDAGTLGALFREKEERDAGAPDAGGTGPADGG